MNHTQRKIIALLAVASMMGMSACGTAKGIDASASGDSSVVSSAMEEARAGTGIPSGGIPSWKP